MNKGMSREGKKIRKLEGWEKAKICVCVCVCVCEEIGVVETCSALFLQNKRKSLQKRKKKRKKASTV